MKDDTQSEDARRKPGVPFWSQAQKEDSSASVWWPGLPRSPARHSPKRQRGQHLRFSVPRAHHLRVRCQKGGSESRGSRRTRPGRQKLALGTWNVTSLGGKEPELVREVDRYQLDLVGLTFTHSVEFYLDDWIHQA